MGDFTITPWKRYGHDRAYANATDEAKAPLAYIDLATRRVTIAAPCDEHAVTAALIAWAEENRGPAPAESGTSSPARTSEELADLPEGTTAEDIPDDEISFEEWLDLADRAPGTYAREQARLEYERDKRVGLIFASITRLSGARSDSGAWRSGAKGEERIGAVLDRLEKNGWRTLHSIPTARGDIDHLAIGPGGVILINTKHHHRAKVSVTRYGIYVNGHKTDHAPQARRQASRAYSALKAAGAPVPWVQACVAIYNGGLLQPEMKKGASPPGVWVVTNWNIGNVLRRLDPVLSDAEINAIYEVARRSTTWTT